jgi:hypothetical protein
MAKLLQKVSELLRDAADIFSGGGAPNHGQNESLGISSIFFSGGGASALPD